MKRDDHKAGSAHDRRAVLVYYAINILLFPVTLLGYVIWAGKTALTGRRSGVTSGTGSPPR